jgi:hypothetical protein
MEANLPNQGSLLVAQIAANRDTPLERTCSLSETPGFGSLEDDSGKDCEECTKYRRCRYSNQRFQVHQHGPAGIVYIGNVHTAFRSTESHQITSIDSTEQSLPCSAGRVRIVLQDPLYLGPEKYVAG